MYMKNRRKIIQSGLIINVFLDKFHRVPFQGNDCFTESNSLRIRKPQLPG